MTACWIQIFFWGYENVLKLIVAMVAQFFEYTKNHSVVHFKWLNSMVCESKKLLF